MSRRRATYFLLALLVPLSALIPWILLDKNYMSSDPGEYVLNALQIFSKWKHQGWHDGISAIYLLRMRKQVLLPVFGALALGLTGGNILWANRLCDAAFFTLFLSFAFLGFEMILPPAESALATAFLGLLPWCAFSAHYFGLEIPVLACCAAGLFWLARCFDMKSPKAAGWFGFFLGIGSCLHPVTVPLFFLVPVVAWVAKGFREKTVRFWDVALWIAAISPFLIIFLLQLKLPLIVQALFLCGPTVILLFSGKRFGLNRAFSRAMGVGILIPAIWFAPVLGLLFDWVFQSTYSNSAKTLSASPVGIELIERYLVWLGGIPLGIVALAAALRISKRSWKFRGGIYLWTGISTVVFPLIVGCTTHDRSIRYYYASSALLFFILCGFALRPGAVRGKVGRALVAISVLFCWLWSFQTILFPRSAIKLLPDERLQEFFQPVTPVARAPVQSVLDTLATNLSPGAHGISIYKQMPEGFVTYLGDDTSLCLAAHDRGLEWEFDGCVSGRKDDLALVGLAAGTESPFLRLMEMVLPGWVLQNQYRFSQPGMEGTLLVLKGK